MTSTHRPATAHDGLLHELTEAQCWQQLAEHQVGHIAYLVGGEPIILPLNYAASDGKIWLRTASYNQLATHLSRQAVAFAVDEVDHHGHTGWSVLVQGRAEHVLDAATTPAWAETTPWPDGLRTMMFSITPTRITGRVLRHADVAPGAGSGPGSVQRLPSTSE